MALNEEVLEEIAVFVRAGFDDRDRIIEIFLEELYEPGEWVPDEIAQAVDKAQAEHEAEKASWPDTTDCDRLNAAFENLEAYGVIALHNAGNTQSDGYSDFCEALHQHTDPSSIQGYCFYHWQDLERAVTGHGLCLAFGPANPKEEESRGAAVGSVVMQALEEAGLNVEWDGSFNQRILVPMDWKRR